ncbi:MAG: universal stress protein, partial [Candidatus Deferrimicrobium sp.]
MNILLPVSRGASFDMALRLAIDTAKAHAGRVRVLSVVDAAEIRRIEAGGHIGAIHLARHAADEVRKRMTAEGTVAVARAVRRCEEEGVPAQGKVLEGELEQELVAASGACDLLVSSTASHFDPDLEDASGKLVLSVMREGGIPILLSGAPYRPARTIVAGCGGGPRT